MKNKSKRLLTLVMSAVLTLSSVTISGLTAHSESQQNNNAVNSDVNVSGSIGSLFSEEFRDMASDEEPNDYGVYDIDYDPKTSMIDICYGAKTDCTLFIGFYNDAGTDLIYSKTVDIGENHLAKVKIDIPEKLPDYYLIKCFIVDDMKKPLCKVKSDDTHTKAIHDILNKKYDDKEFDQNNVLFFEENDKNNFFVTKQELHSITSTDNADHYIRDDEAEEKGVYSFDKIDKIADLKKGDEVVVYTDSQSLLFIIDSIKISGDKATIKTKDCELEDLCGFIKLDSSTLPSAKKAKVEVEDEFKEKVECEVIEDPEEIPSDKEKDTKKKSDNPFEVTLDSPTALANEIGGEFINRITIKLKDLTPQSDVDVTGQITLDTTFGFYVYLSEDYKSVNLNLSNIFYLELEGKISINKQLPFFLLLVNGPFIYIRVDFYADFLLSGKLFCSISSDISAKIHSKDMYGKVIECDYTPPKLKINGAYGVIQFAIQPDLNIGIFHKKVLSFHLKPEAGIEVLINEVQAAEANGIFSEAELQFDDNNQADPDTHPCIICFPGEVKFFADINAEGKAFGHDVTANLARCYVPFGKCYCSAVLGFGWGECPNKGRSKSLSPDENTVNPFELRAVDPLETKGTEESDADLVQKEGKLGDHINYTLFPNGTMIITGYGDMDENITNKELNDVCTKVKEVYFVDCGLDYKNIGKGLFKGCSNLTTIELPSSITTIGNYAFSGCSSLNNIEIPSTVTTIGEEAFRGCSSIPFGDYKLPDGIVTLGSRAFRECHKLTSLEIPDTVESMGSGIVDRCLNLEQVTLPFAGETKDAESGEILNLLFGYIDSDYDIAGGHNGGELSDEYKDKFITRSHSGGVAAVPLNLKTITITGGDHIPDSAFSNCDFLTDLILPEGIKTIGNNAFSNCSGLTALTLPESVTIIKDNAFRDCSKLINLNIPSNVESIGNKAFWGCSSLESIQMSSKVKVIGESCFQFCTKLKEVEIPEGVKEIGSFAFRECTDLKSIVLPKSIEKMGVGIVQYCVSLEEVTIPFIGDTREDDRPRVLRTLFYENLTDTGKSSGGLPPDRLIGKLYSRGYDRGYGGVTAGIPKNFKTISITDSKSIHNDAFEGCDFLENIYIYGEKGSDAETFATDHNYTFQEVNSDDTTPVTESEDFIFGDANYDGNIDMGDAVIIMQAIANPNVYGVNGTSPIHITEEGWKRADVCNRGDGVTLKDALAIQKYLLQLIDALPES